MPLDDRNEVLQGAYPLHPTNRPPVVFPGLAPYVERAGALARLSPEVVGRAKLGWHAQATQQALAGLCELAGKVRIGHAAPESLAGALERVRDVRAGLAAQLQGIDDAIVATFEALEIPVPRSIKQTKPRG